MKYPRKLCSGLKLETDWTLLSTGGDEQLPDVLVEWGNNSAITELEGTTSPNLYLKSPMKKD